MNKLEITKETTFKDLVDVELEDLFAFLKENMTEDENETLDDVGGSYVAETGLVHEFIATFIINHFVCEMTFGDSLSSALREWDI